MTLDIERQRRLAIILIVLSSMGMGGAVLTGNWFAGIYAGITAISNSAMLAVLDALEDAR